MRSICGPTIPILLVGCKADLRPPPNAPDIGNYVSRAQAERVASEIGARAYKECSALKIEGVDDVFEAATRASMLMREGAPSGSAGHRYGEQATGETGWGWKCRVSMPHMHMHVHGPRPLCHVCDVSLFAHCIFFLFLLYALLCVCFM